MNNLPDKNNRNNHFPNFGNKIIPNLEKTLKQIAQENFFWLELYDIQEKWKKYIEELSTSAENNFQEIKADLDFFLTIEKTSEILKKLSENEKKIFLNEMKKHEINITEVIKKLTESLPKEEQEKIKHSSGIPVIHDKKATQRKLFTENTLETTPSNAIIDTMYSICVRKDVKFTEAETMKELSTKKTYTSGVVEILLKEVQASILSEYGQDTVKIMYCLLGQAFKKQNKEVITISGEELLDHLKKKWDKQGKYLRKEHNLSWLLHHLKLLRNIWVFIGKWETKGKTFMVEETPLLSFQSLLYYSQLKIDGTADLSQIHDLYIEFKAGKWADFFLDETGQYLKQCGFIHEETLAIDTKSGMTEAIGTWLTLKLEQNQKSEFKVATVLEETGFKNRLDAIAIEQNTAKKGSDTRNLKRDWDYAIAKLTNLKRDPYKISYTNPPEWISKNSTRKPKGWYSQWLNLTVKFTLPELENFTKKQTTETKLTVAELKQAMKKHHVSIRQLIEHYDATFYWLQSRLKSEKLTQAELKDLFEIVLHLGGSSK